MKARTLWVSLACVTALACTERRTGDLPVRVLDPPAAPGSTAPRLSSLGDRLVLSWIEPAAAGGVALRFSSFGAGGWSSGRTVVSDPLVAVDPANVPGVVPLSGGAWAAFWSMNPTASETHARTLSVATSADGTTWSDPQHPHGTVPTDHAMASLVSSPDGARFGIAWLDGRAGEVSEYGEGGTGLYWADWNGSSFSRETALDARVCDCCKTSAAWTPQGPIVAYRDRGDNERRDISLVARNGEAWSDPAWVRDDGWVLTACPTNGPAIATHGPSTVIGWFSGGGGQKAVRVALSSDAGRTLGPAIRVDGGDPVGRVETTVLPDGSAAVVWIERVGGGAEVRARRVGVEGIAAAPVTVAATSPSKKSGYPRAVATGPREILVAWIDTTTEAASRVRAATVSLP